MSAIGKAIAEMKFRIPHQILDKVFIQRTMRWRQTPISVDDQLLALVIRPRVLVDCDIVGGTETFIPLENVPVDRGNDYTSVYRIPKERTNGRSITSVLNITYSDPTRLSNYGISATCQNTTMMQTGQAVMDAMGSIPVTSTASVQLIGENVVMVRDTVVMPANIYLRCILGNDENLSHIQIRSYAAFCKLVEYAVKSYIYNSYIVELDMGELFAGQNLGRIKEIIDSYSDAEELYQTHLREVMQKVLFMNDGETWKRFIKLRVGGNR